MPKTIPDPQGSLRLISGPNATAFYERFLSRGQLALASDPVETAVAQAADQSLQRGSDVVVATDRDLTEAEEAGVRARLMRTNARLVRIEVDLAEAGDGGHAGYRVVDLRERHSTYAVHQRIVGPIPEPRILGLHVIVGAAPAAGLLLPQRVADVNETVPTGGIDALIDRAVHVIQHGVSALVSFPVLDRDRLRRCANESLRHWGRFCSFDVESPPHRTPCLGCWHPLDEHSADDDESRAEAAVMSLHCLCCDRLCGRETLN